MANPVNRGDVFLVSLRFDRPQPNTELKKYVVALQGGPDFAMADDVAVVVCSTRRGTRPVRPFEVIVGTAHGFDTETVIDCRWVRTIPKPAAVRSLLKTRLTSDVMEQVSEALVLGLQL
jgi:mRNA-degrading endonuclease toxin of MazEF toxin-antitoxin module